MKPLILGPLKGSLFFASLLDRNPRVPPVGQITLHDRVKKVTAAQCFPTAPWEGSAAWRAQRNPGFLFFSEPRNDLRLLSRVSLCFRVSRTGPSILIAPSASGSARTNRLLQIKVDDLHRTICEFHAPALEKHGTLSLGCELMG